GDGDPPGPEGVRPEAATLIGHLGVDLDAPRFGVDLRADVRDPAGRLGAAVIGAEGDRLADAHQGHVLEGDVEVDVQPADVADDEQGFGLGDVDGLARGDVALHHLAVERGDERQEVGGQRCRVEPAANLVRQPQQAHEANPADVGEVGDVGGADGQA